MLSDCELRTMANDSNQLWDCAQMARELLAARAEVERLTEALREVMAWAAPMSEAPLSRRISAERPRASA